MMRVRDRPGFSKRHSGPSTDPWIYIDNCLRVRFPGQDGDQCYYYENNPAEPSP